MSKWTKILCWVLTPLGVLFCFVGYAALTTTLTIEGTAEATPPNAVYILEVMDVQYTNAAAVDVDGAPANVDFPSTKFMANIRFERNSSVRIQVKIKNGTAVNQIFNILKRHDGEPNAFDYDGIVGSNNPSVTLENGENAQGTKLEPGQEQIFWVTIKYSNWKTDTNNMLYEFEFVLDTADLTQKASQAVLERFKQIINTPEEYQQLKSNMNAGDTGGYIANSAGAEEADKEVINRLFEDTLKLTFEDTEYPITILAKEESVCSWNDTQQSGRPGRPNYQPEVITEERALYMTADSLNGVIDPAPVFVVVFYETDDGWVQVGEEGVILEGTAPVIDYSGQDEDGTGNFQTNEWVSTKEYFGVPAGSTLKQIMAACDPDT